MRSIENMNDIQKDNYNDFLNFYNEKNTLVLSNIMKKNRELKKDTKYYQAYLKIIKNTATLLKELNADDPVKANTVFQYLLWNGYFSKDKYLEYGMSSVIDSICYGANVMLGKTLCLNNATMAADVLNEMGIKSYLIGSMFIPVEGRIINNDNHIKRNISNENVILSTKNIDITGNHALNLTQKDDKYFLSDPTNLAFLNFNDFLEAKYVDSDITTPIKPWMMLVMESVEHHEFHHTIMNTFKYSDSEVVASKEIKEAYNFAQVVYDKNQNLLADFHNYNKPHIETVCKTLKK